MFRFRRVNIDGKSITETYAAGEEVLPGTPVKLVSGEFMNATDTEGRLYIVNPAYHEGKGIGDAIAEGETVVADYAEQGREFAVLVPAGTYTKDAGITIGKDGFDLASPASGEGEEAVPADPVFAYCQEDVTLEDNDFIRVRVA